MRRIQSAIDPLSSTYRSYERHSRHLRDRLHECQRKARHERPDRDVDRLRKQNNLDVPKLTLMTNGSFGAGNYAMCGRAFDARFLFSWPNSQISVMGMEQAAKTLSQVRIRSLERQGKKLSDEDVQQIYEGIKQDYMEKSGAYHATSELWDDGIIDPADTRTVLGIALSASLNREFKQTPNGVLRI